MTEIYIVMDSLDNAITAYSTREKAVEALNSLEYPLGGLYIYRVDWGG